LDNSKSGKDTDINLTEMFILIFYDAANGTYSKIIIALCKYTEKKHYSTA